MIPLISKAIIAFTVFPFVNYVLEHSDDKDFVQQFPYDKYMSVTEYTNCNTLIKHTDVLQENNQDPHSFLHQLFAYHLVASPIDLENQQDWSKQMDFATALFTHDSLVLQIQGDFLLQTLSDTLTKGLEQEEVSSTDPFWSTQIEVLKAHKYIIDIPVSDQEKLFRYLSNGRIDYILKRFKTRCITDCSQGNVSGLCALFWSVCIVVFCSILVAIYIKKRNRFHPRTSC